MQRPYLRPDADGQPVDGLDAAALHEMAAHRLAGYIAHRSGKSYDAALAEVNAGWPITAVGCELICDDAVSAIA